MVYKKNIPAPYWLVLLIFIVAGLFISGKWQTLMFAMRGETGMELVETCHSQYGFSIRHPKIWHPQLYGQAGLHGVSDLKLMITNGRTGPTITVYYHPVREPTIDQALNWQKAIIDASSMTVVETKAIAVDTNIQAIATTYQRDKFTYEAITFVRNDGMFTFLFQNRKSDDEQDRMIFEAMVVSFASCQDSPP